MVDGPNDVHTIIATWVVDYVSAFCQAPIEEEVYFGLPRGWETLNNMSIPQKFNGNFT